MRDLCFDLLWHVVSETDGRDMLTCRRVCVAWRAMIDTVTPSEWKKVYTKRIAGRTPLQVGVMFDWRMATMLATGHIESIDAFCTWNQQDVCIVPPWKSTGLTYDENERALFDTYLRTGVDRCAIVYSSIVDFSYSKIIRLRGRQRSCLFRNAVSPCHNCTFIPNRRRCLNPQYQYYIRPTSDVDPVVLDECLAFLLTKDNSRERRQRQDVVPSNE